MQYAAFKEGYSFNTLLEGQDLRDSLRVKRSGDNIKVASGKTTATVGTNGAKTCMVRHSPNICFPHWLVASAHVSSSWRMVYRGVRPSTWFPTAPRTAKSHVYALM